MSKHEYCIDLMLLDDKRYKISLLKDSKERKYNNPQDFGYFTMNNFIFTFNNLLKERDLHNYYYEIDKENEEVEYVITAYDITDYLKTVWNAVGLIDKGHQIGNDEPFDF